MSPNPLPKLVIVGGGFGGLMAAKALARSPVDLTVIDRCNHHLFQPLLYQVATAGLSPANIAVPIRHIVGRASNTRVLLGTVNGVDRIGKAVLVGSKRVPYDWLILATGATHAYPNPDWARAAPGLKTVEDATLIRARILRAFERAEASDDAVDRQQHLTFVVVGGGPTGVELAGAISEIARRALPNEFRRVDTTSARILLVEGAPRLLTALPEDLSEYAKRALEKLGVEVQLGHFVETIDRKGVVLKGDRIDARTVLWAAGVKASPAGEWLGVETDQAGRVVVDETLTLPGAPEIFVIGDTASVQGPNNTPVPGIAPAAKQMGLYAAEAIKSRLFDAPPPTAFRYRHAGNLATIGRSSAVVDFGKWKLRGWIAWMTWGAAHIWFLIGFRNKLIVMAEWLWAYLTFKKGMRLITGPEEEEG
jgi:NADH:quinone reductase (non-electrogenic)